MYLLNTKIRLTMLCLSGFELYSPLGATDYALSRKSLQDSLL